MVSRDGLRSPCRSTCGRGSALTTPPERPPPGHHVNLDDLATVTPLEAGPEPKECTGAWLLRVLPPDRSDALRRALDNDAAHTGKIVEALVGDEGVPERFARPERINHHRAQRCGCSR